MLHFLAENEPEYTHEYTMALNSFLNIKTLFLRAVSLYYFSDIEVCFRNSVVVKQIFELQNYIANHKGDILGRDIYDIKKYFPGKNLMQFARDLNIVEAFCLNILLSYTAVQDQEYAGKKYSALTIDYGSFLTTDVYARDRYHNWAILKPRLHMLGAEAYYDDYLQKYRSKLKELGNFDSPKELRQELTTLIKHKYNKTGSNTDFFNYAKHFEKQDSSRTSLWGSLVNIAVFVNPLMKLNPATWVFDKKDVCSFEIDNYFPRKKICGVCDMISAGQSWSLDTVRVCMFLSGCFVFGIFIYIALAIAMKHGFYLGVQIERH